VLTLSPESYAQASYWLGWGTLVTTGLFLVLLFVLKRIDQVRQQHHAAFQQAWLPVLTQVALGDRSVALPNHADGDGWMLIKLWVKFQVTLRGEAQDRLRLLGQTLGCARLARERLHSQHRSEQIFSVLTLGYLREAVDLPLIEPLLKHPSNTVATYAAWAFLQLNPTVAAPQVLAQLLERPDIDIQRVASILKPFRHVIQQEWHRQMAHIAERGGESSTPATLAWLLKIGATMGCVVSPSLLLPYLHAAQPMNVLIGAIRLSQTADEVQAIRLLSGHPDWQVRTQVAVALGRLGDLSDTERLQSLLMDAQWWVRYRAAQALFNLPGLSRVQAAELIEALPDRYARDIGQHVLAEIDRPST
jgi:hypothetical protein